MNHEICKICKCYLFKNYNTVKLILIQTTFYSTMIKKVCKHVTYSIQQKCLFCVCKYTLYTFHTQNVTNNHKKATSDPKAVHVQTNQVLQHLNNPSKNGKKDKN